MNGREYQYQEMLHEYDALRAEILQVYDQQMSLVFSAAITAAGAFVVSLLQLEAGLLNLPAGLLSLPILLALLFGVCNKSIANYARVFRIGSYIAIFHETHGKAVEDFKPGTEKASWHSRWRRVSQSEKMRNKSHLIGAESPRAEALFLLVLGLSGWVLAVASLKVTSLTDTTTNVLLHISIIFTVFLIHHIYQLWGVLATSKIYEEIFRDALEDELREN